MSLERLREKIVAARGVKADVVAQIALPQQSERFAHTDLAALFLANAARRKFGASFSKSAIRSHKQLSVAAKLRPSSTQVSRVLHLRALTMTAATSIRWPLRHGDSP